MVKIIDTLVDNIRNSIFKIIGSTKAGLYTNYDKSRIVKLFCAYHTFGEEIVDWEPETFEIVMGRQGFSYNEIEDVQYMVYLIHSRDYVLTNRHHFENAVQILNDDVVYMEETDYQPTHKIIWAIILLMVLYGAENMPIDGDAIEYVSECFIKEGWTQPPLFFATNKKFENSFPYYDKEFIDKALVNVNELIELSKVKDPKDAFENYYKFHAHIIQYLMDKTQELEKQIKSITGS